MKSQIIALEEGFRENKEKVKQGKKNMKMLQFLSMKFPNVLEHIIPTL